mgnify:CR=1 FL=1
MEIKENMYYGVGKVALAIAKADGEINASEIEALKEITKETEEKLKVDLGLIYITFQYFKKYNDPIDQLVDEGIHNFHLGDDYLTPKLARSFRHLLVEIAKAQPPITEEEDVALTKFLNYLELRELEQAANAQ